VASEVTQSRIERLAARELEQFAGRIPVPVEEIVRAGGARVVRNRHDGQQSSFHYRETARLIIGVNSSPSPRRVRFAIAHAYGHALLCDRPLMVCHSVDTDPDRERTPSEPSGVEESEANWFAGCLLMPADAVRAALVRQVGDGYESRDELIQRLAAEFEVSREAMGWRLIWLGLTMG
jgi:Zn-dependent peptidase ImmA (M78 family)